MREATVIAWLWARTVKCPNPACGAQMPLVRSFWLSTKKGKEAWVDPIIDNENKTVRFEVKIGKGNPPDRPRSGVERNFAVSCVARLPRTSTSRTKAWPSAWARSSWPSWRTEGADRLPPTPEHEQFARSAQPDWAPNQELPYEPRAIWCTLYGLTMYRDLFTSRQLVALTTFSDLVGETRDRVLSDALTARMADDGIGIDFSGSGSRAYADGIVTYLTEMVSKATVFHNVMARWRAGEGKSAPAFGRQAIPMVWDFAEVNPFAGAGRFLRYRRRGSESHR